MSVGKRAYNIARGYVNREWDRLAGLELTVAEAELAESETATLAASNTRTIVIPIPTDPEERRTLACRFLGVNQSATFAEVRKAFVELDSRSNPEKFPEGSTDQQKARELRQKLNWAYQVLTENVDVIEKRFGTLEID